MEKRSKVWVSKLPNIKTIMVQPATWQKLMQIKIELMKRSLDETIEELISNWQNSQKKEEE